MSRSKQTQPADPREPGLKTVHASLDRRAVLARLRCCRIRAFTAAPLIGMFLSANASAAQLAGPAGLLVCREARLVPSNLVPGEDFGYSMSFDGDRLAVMSRNYSRATVFLRGGGGWIEEALITPPAIPVWTPTSSIGLQVDTLALGKLSDSTVSQFAGGCYVYSRTAGSWGLQAALYAADASPSDYFGRSLCLDGDTLLVGASADDDMGLDSGSAYVFTRAGGIWTQQAKLLANDGQAGDGFGIAVALEGDLAIVTSLLDDDQGTDSGSAYVFRRTGQIWTQQAKLLAPVTGALPNAYFGYSVAISAGRVLVGTPATWSGVVAYYFEQSGANWVLQDTLVPGTAGSYLMALDFKGNRAVIGATQCLVPGTNDYVGRAFVYERTGLNWNQIGVAGRDPGLVGAGYATSVSISGDRFVVGTPGEPQPQNQNLVAGMATVYTFVPEPVTYCTGKLNSMSCMPAMDMRGIPSGSALSGFQILCTEVMNNEAGLLLYGTNGRANLPFSGGTLCMTAPLKRTVGLNSSGTPPPAVDCSGVFSLDMSGFAAGLLGGTPSPALRIAGTTVQCQWWGRDPGFPPPFNTTLSNALEFVVCP